MLTSLAANQRGKHHKKLNMDKGIIQSKGVKYAKTPDAAFEALKTEIPDLDSLDDREIMGLIETACNPKLGLEQAIKVANDKFQTRRKERDGRKKQREQNAKSILNNFDWMDGDPTYALVACVLQTAAAAYEDWRKNVEVIGSYSEDLVREALDLWSGLNGQMNLTNMHGFPPQDKAAQGKGNVGATLARRRVQANFISTWFSFVVNVHVNVR